MRGGSRAALTAAGVGFVLVVCACGQVESLFSGGRTYDMDARLGAPAANEAALLRAGDEVRPFFVDSMEGDRDVGGVRAYFQVFGGERAGPVIVYTLAREGDDDGTPGRVLSTQDAAGEGDGGLGGEGLGDAGGTGDGDTDGDTDGEGDAGGTGDTDGEGDAGGGGNMDGEGDAAAEGDAGGTGDAGAAADGVIRVEVTDLGMLPGFVPDEGLEAGRYRLVFEVLSLTGKVVARTEKPVYYLAGLEYGLTDLSVYLPDTAGASAASLSLIPPGMPALLEARVRADEGLEPYIAWFNGKLRIGGGPLTDGTSRLLWKAPDQTGIQQIRVEVLPFPPMPDRLAAAGSRLILGGKMRELSLPVSAKGEVTASVTAAAAGARGDAAAGITAAGITATPARAVAAAGGDAAGDALGGGEAAEPALARLYRFRGSLRDSVENAPERALIPWAAAGDPVEAEAAAAEVYAAGRWLPAGRGYGLGAGPGAAYWLPLEALTWGPDERCRLDCAFNLLPVDDGVLLHAAFPLRDGEAVVECVLDHGVVTLTLGYGGREADLRAPAPAGTEFAVVTLGVDFSDEEVGISLAGGERLSIARPALRDGEERDGETAGAALLGARPEEADAAAAAAAAGDGVVVTAAAGTVADGAAADGAGADDGAGDGAAGGDAAADGAAGDDVTGDGATAVGAAAGSAAVDGAAAVNAAAGVTVVILDELAVTYTREPLPREEADAEEGTPGGAGDGAGGAAAGGEDRPGYGGAEGAGEGWPGYSGAGTGVDSRTGDDGAEGGWGGRPVNGGAGTGADSRAGDGGAAEGWGGRPVDGGVEGAGGGRPADGGAERAGEGRPGSGGAEGDWGNQPADGGAGTGAGVEKSPGDGGAAGAGGDGSGDAAGQGLAALPGNS